METVVQRPVESDLHLLTEWGDADGPARRRKALAATVAVHVGLILTLAALPPIMAPMNRLGPKMPPAFPDE